MSGLDSFSTVGSIPTTGPCGKLYRSAQPDKLAFATIVDLGIDVVVKLNPDDEDTPLKDEQENFQTGEVIQAPDPMSMDTEDWLGSIVGDVGDRMLQGKDVLLHCSRGRNRTGYVVAAFRVLQSGWSLDAAIDEFKACGGSSIAFFKNYKIKKLLKQVRKKYGKDAGDGS